MGNTSGYSTASSDSNSFDLSKIGPGILQSLLDLAVPNATANTQKQADTMSQQTQQQQMQLPPAHQAAVDGALQGVKKAASEAAASGGLDAANHIINLATTSAIGQGFGGQQPAPLDMNSLLQQSPLVQNNQNTNTTQDVEGLKQQIQKNILQNLLAQSQPKGILGGFAQGFNNAVGNTAANMENLKNIANISGLSPEAQYQQAGASELIQSAQGKALANQGKTPMQEQDKKAALALAQQKQIEALKAQLDSENASLQANVKTQGDIISHPASMIFGGQSLKDIHSAILSNMTRKGELQTQIDQLSGNYAEKSGAPTSTPTNNLVGKIVTKGGQQYKLTRMVNGRPVGIPVKGQ